MEESSSEIEKLLLELGTIRPQVYFCGYVESYTELGMYRFKLGPGIRDSVYIQTPRTPRSSKARKWGEMWRIRFRGRSILVKTRGRVVRELKKLSQECWS